MSIKIDLQNQIRQTNLPKWKPLLPAFEAVINSCQAINDVRPKIVGKIKIKIERETVLFDEENPPIIGFRITDNGIGLNDDNFDSFNTAFTPHRLSVGGKGLGRFTWLKAFDRVEIASTFSEDDQPGLLRRKFAKNDTPRGIALHAQIVELLRVIIGERNAGYVFLTDEGLPYATSPKKAWYGACERAGIRNFHIHDLRHTFATNLLVAGVDVRFAEKQMGHAGKNAMNSRYAHVPDLELIAAINRLPRVASEIPDFRTWARSGYGRVEPRQNEAETLIPMRSRRIS